MKERDFSTQVTDLLLRFGWHFYGVFEQRSYARRTMKGFPDRVAWRPATGQLIFIELKGTGGELTPDQMICHAQLRACGQTVLTWWPDDPGLEAMEEVLR